MFDRLIEAACNKKKVGQYPLYVFWSNLIPIILFSLSRSVSSCTQERARFQARRPRQLMD